MKNKFRFSFMLLICGIQVTYSQNYTLQPKIYAVIIGVAGYEDTEIPDLKFAEKDAMAFYNFLRSANAGGVPEENIALLTGEKATRKNIITEVVDKFTRATKEDLVIFYFSGHGRAGVFANDGYLLSYDTDYGSEVGTAVAMEDIKSKINKCQAKMKLSYIDACHAGFFKTDAKGSLEAENQTIVSAYLEGISKADGGNITFMASSAMQQSLEMDKLGHGVFTYYLLEGLKGAADLEHKGSDHFDNGIVTSGELATYLVNKIQGATSFKQKPIIEGDPDGFFPLSVLRPNISIANEIAKRPAKVKPIAGKKEIIVDKPCNSNKGDYCLFNTSIYRADIYLDQDPGLVSSNVNLSLSAGETGCLMDLKEGVHSLHITYIYEYGVKSQKTMQIRVEPCTKNPKPVTIKN